MRKHIYISSVLVLIITSILIGCKKDEFTPDNPYDSVDYGNETTAADTSNLNSLMAIHRDIIFPNCATPGCHDGAFEPDFRSVMSTYSTLVYHPIVKNNTAETFTYRVVPFRSDESVLYERISNCCFVNTNDRMPQSNIGTALPDDEIARIKAWIDEGAKDFDGVSSKYPNTEPNFQWFSLMDIPNFPAPPYINLSVDSNRIDDLVTNPLAIDTGMTAYFVIEVSDDSTASADISNGTLWYGYDKNNYSNSFKSTSTTFLDVDEGLWYCTVNTNDFLTDTTIYLRYSCNDGDHSSDTYLPNDDSPDWYKGVWSMQIIEGGKK